MTKLMTVLAAAFFAVTVLFGSGAEAGFNVRINAPALSLMQKAGCHGGGFRVYQRRYHIVRRSVRPKVQVARVQRAEPVTVAKVEEPKVEEQKVEDTVAPATDSANTENSSISTNENAAAADTTKADDTAATDDTTEKTADTDAAVKDDKKVATKATDCKAFFPAINKALTVPCH